MTYKERIKNNILIAEFMGMNWKPSGFYPNGIVGRTNSAETPVKDLSYHNSWDALRP